MGILCAVRETREPELPMNILLLIIFPIVAAIGAIGSNILGGIAVPGRSVPILRLFENYAASCVPTSTDKKDFGMDQLSQLMQSLNAEDVAQKIYNSLFFSMGDVDIDKFMGRWFTVVDSRKVHQEDCMVIYMSLMAKAEYTATFSVIQYSKLGKEVVMHEGYGRMVGPDPGELLISTGHPADQCPFVPVRLGGIQSDGTYNYVIISTPLKFPTMVLSRDIKTFDSKYKKEVYGFLEKYGFLSPIAALNTRLHFVNTTECEKQNNHYMNIEII